MGWGAARGGSLFFREIYFPASELRDCKLLRGDGGEGGEGAGVGLLLFFTFPPTVHTFDFLLKKKGAIAHFLTAAYSQV